MSFREKHLWISIVATVIVWGHYGVRLFHAISEGGLADPAFARDIGGLFVTSLVIVVLLELGLTLFATLTTPKDERDTRDEREMLASLRASHVSLSVLVVLVVTLAGAAYFAGLASPAFGTRLALTDTNAFVLLANVLIGSVIVSEMTRYVFTLALLRRPL